MLSKTSYTLAKNIIPIKNFKLSKDIDTFLRFFYNYFINAKEQYDNLLPTLKFTNEHYTFNSFSPYMDIKIKNELLENNYKTFNFMFKIKNITFNIKFLTLRNSPRIEQLYFYLKNIFILYYIIVSLPIKKCFNNIDIIIYLSEHQRKLPTDNLSIIDCEHVNGGYTTCCTKKSEIIVYRQEEWFKVLIHESIHAFGLDFCKFDVKNLTHKVFDFFPIKVDLLLFETYSELWANILNIYFISFNNCHNNFSQLKQLFSHYYNIEVHFQIFQMNKILHFMNLTYDDLYKNNKESIIKRNGFYRENTNVFCYYIIKSILFCNLSTFLNWAKYNNRSYIIFNKSDRNLELFVKLIQDKYKKKTLTSFIKNIFDTYNSKYKNKKSIIQTTMRMSTFDFKYLA